MNNYPQYIHVPTTVPVQRYFANPYVSINSYAWGGADGLNTTLNNQSGVTGAGKPGQWMGIGDKIDVGVGKVLGKFGINAGSSPITGLSSGVLGAVGDGVYNILGGKNKTGVGNALNAASKFAGMIPGVGKVAGLALNGIGALINRGWGSHRDATRINAINADTNALNNTRVTDSSNESIANQATAQDWGGAFDYSDMGETGWFNKGKFEDEFNRMMRARASGQNYMAANYDNASTNVQKNMMNNLLAGNYAFGGYFDNPFSHPGSGAVAYGFEQQNLANQQQMLGQMQAQQMQQQQPNQPQQYGFGGCMPFCFGGKFFADGGDMNSHGADFTNGLVYIENGGTHEENPYQGVPMGYDSQGTPNVVEEDEVIAPKRLLGNGGESDFVFSNRIPIPDEFAEKYHFPYGISFSDAVKRFTKESREVPNDVIYENTNKKFLAEARDLQEQIKAEQQQQEMAMAQQAFQQLPPEQQQAMAQQAMQQEQMQAMQEQAPEAGMMQPGAETFQPSMGAFGGNLYAPGGRLITLGDIPSGFVDEYGDTMVSFPSGNRVPLSTAYTEYAPTHVYVEDIPHLSDYMMRQEQPDIATAREVVNEQNRRKHRGRQEAIDSTYWTGANLAWLIPAMKGLFDYTASSGAADAVLGAVESGPFKGFPSTPGEFNRAFNLNPYLYGRLHRWIRNSGIPEKVASGLNKAEDFAGKVVDYFNSDDDYPEAAIPGGGDFGGGGGGSSWGDEPEPEPQVVVQPNLVDDVVIPLASGMPISKAYGGYFGSVNSFAEKGDIKRGNRVLPEFADTGEPWAATTGQQLMKQLKAELASADGNPLAVEEVFNKYNELWKLAEAAKMADYRTGNYLSSDEIDALQDKFGELGLNSGITDELFAKYFDPEYQAGKTTDNAANGYKKDGVAGDITGFLRNLGIGNIPEATAKELNDLAEQYGYRYFKPDDSEYWRFGNLYDENFNNKGNYIGPELNDTQSVTEEQLNAAEGKPSGKYAMPWLSTAGRDLPIWEAGLARLLDDLGLGTKPDYSYADSLAALANTSNGYMPVSYKPVGQYITPALFDPYQPLLNADAQYGQASRAVQDNSNGNAAMANASQVALARNAMMANGAIAETGQKFNADQRHAAADFGRTTDLSNSQGILSADAQNAQNWAQNRNMYAYRMGEALAARKAEKDAADAVILNNRRMFTDAIAKKAKENMYYNMVNHHPAYGGYGMDPRTGGILYQGHFDDGTPYWGNPGQSTPSMATNPYVANQPFNFGSFLNGLFNPYA